ncbi:MAG: OmpA family protein, partial [Candidatus Cloacimonetes bacterium]|nr:OmpA family protein [Candidatus Cloacimonadota bacterium]
LPLMPLGVGFHTRIKPGMKLEVTTGYNLSNSDMLDGLNRKPDEMNSYTDKKQDGFFSLTVGLSFSNERQEPAPKVVETVPYVKPIPVTPPAPVPVPVVIPEPTPVPVVDLSKLDSDNDGLSDADEIDKYKTDPQNPDTDGDGLKDGAEVTKHKTDPLNPDTDGDGLKDGAEVTIHDTDPLNPDTDGDGLKDGAEVLTHKTNPLVKDTDKGTVDDGKEVAAGTNPLDPSDDVFKLEEGKTFTLDGIVFETGKATILPASEKILEQAYGVLAANPNLNILITGHTDSVGSASSNLSLSQRRADAVMNWLIKRGIDANRLKAEGKGLTKPKATNSTPEGRQINRRIDFEVVH